MQSSRQMKSCTGRTDTPAGEKEGRKGERKEEERFSLLYRGGLLFSFVFE